MPVASFTDGPQQVSLALGVPKQIVPARMNRNGLVLTNGSSVIVLVAIGAVDPSPTLYTKKLAAGEDWVLPLVYCCQEIRAYAGALLAINAGLCFTEFYVP
jgi:hypothetical protein